MTAETVAAMMQGRKARASSPRPPPTTVSPLIETEKPNPSSVAPSLAVSLASSVQLTPSKRYT